MLFPTAPDSAHIVKMKTFDAHFIPVNHRLPCPFDFASEIYRCIRDASSPFEALLERPRLPIELFTVDNILPMIISI